MQQENTKLKQFFDGTQKKLRFWLMRLPMIVEDIDILSYKNGRSCLLPMDPVFLIRPWIHNERVKLDTGVPDKAYQEMPTS